MNVCRLMRGYRPWNVTELTPVAMNILHTLIFTWHQVQQEQGIHRHQRLPRYNHLYFINNMVDNASPYGPLRPNVTVIHTAGSTTQRRQRRTEPRPQGICTKIMKFGPAVPEIWSRTDRHTDRQADRNTPLPYRGRVTTTKSRPLYNEKTR